MAHANVGPPEVEVARPTVHDSVAALLVNVVGVSKERVELAFFDSRTGKVSTVLCTFGASGVASRCRLWCRLESGT